MSDDESFRADRVRLETSEPNRRTGWILCVLGIHFVGVGRFGGGCSVDCVGEFVKSSGMLIRCPFGFGK